MQPTSYKRHCFPSEVISSAVWLYFRFTLSFRDVEDLLAQRGIEVSRETIRCWALKFGPLIVANLKRRRERPTGRWYLDEMVVRIRGQRMFFCAVDDEGEVLDVLVQKRRNKAAAMKLFRKLLSFSPPGRPHGALHFPPLLAKAQPARTWPKNRSRPCTS